MSMTVELVTKLRDGLSAALRRQNTGITAWQAKVAAAGVAAIGAGLAIARMTQQYIQFADRITQPLARLQDISEGLRVSSADFAALTYVVDQAGGETSAMAPAFQRMRVAITDAGDASSEAGRALDTLNLSQSALLAMDPVQQYIEITGALSQYAGTAEQGAMAQTLFGRGAVNLRGALNLSAGAIRNGMEAARELGVVLGDDAYDAADQFQDMLKTVKDQFNSLLMQGIQPNLPAITELLSSLVEMGESVLPMIFQEAGTVIEIMSDVAAAFKFVKEASDALTPDIVSDFTDEMTSWERFANRVLPGVGLAISGVRQGVDALGNEAESTAPQVDIFAEAMDVVRAAANAAEAELEGLNAQLAGVNAALAQKKAASWEDVLAGREPDTSSGGTGGGIEPVLTLEEMKLAAAEERIDAEKAAEAERIAAIEAAEFASIDRIAAKEATAGATTKQDQIRAEMELAAVREAAINRGIDQTVQFGLGMVHAGLEGQAAWDQFWADFAMRMFDMVMSEAFGMLLSVLSGGGSGFLGNLFGALFAAGGTVRHAAGGMSVPGAHMNDRVPALLTPGEVVLTRAEARDYAAGARGGGGNTFNVTLGSMFSGASRSDLVRAGKVLREVMAAEGIS